MAKKGKSGYYVFGTCDKCGETHRPLTYYNKENLCDTCLAIKKRIPIANRKIKKEEEEKQFWDDIRSGD